MMKRVTRWFGSKNGRRVILGTAVAVVAVALVGQMAGWWSALDGLLTGTVAPPLTTYPAPTGGYTCLPTCDTNDGRFLSMPGEDMASFGGAKAVFWISVPGDYPSFELGVFDGDSGKDGSGQTNPQTGNWDDTTTETTYALFADPLKTGASVAPLNQWSSSDMPNNDWFDVSITNVAGAAGPSGHFFYRLEITRPIEGNGINAFKLRSTGYLGTGSSEYVDANFAIVGMFSTLEDIRILYPEFSGSLKNLGPSLYTGEWEFYFYVPEDVNELSIWDGDFDRGGSSTTDHDTDDPNTEGVPSWATASAVSERAGGRGIPSDDYPSVLYRRSPAVRYTFVDPAGAPLYENSEPSGTEEWEHFTVSTDAATNPDLLVDDIKPGFYTMHIVGLDLHNTVWLRLNYEIVDQPPPPVCDATCPRTIGYWKNNIKKTLEGKTNGVQETPESIEAALRLIALESELYRHGIDVLNPQPIADPVPLTLEEAHMILQRDKKTYPGDKKSSQTMLARALQQNLATWLNWGSGKICDFTVISLPGGTFDGRIEDALAEAQTIILNHDDAQMERAKDIGDKINNGLLGEDAGNSTCQDYNQVMPSDRQPPKYDEMPKAPKPDVPDQVDTPPQPDPDTCQGVRTNTYGVENPTNNPFYGIKFEYKSGTEVKNGDFDEFAVVLTQEQVQAMTSFQMEAKAGQNVGMVTLEGCDFTSPLPCGGEPVQDENRFFAFYFMGAQDNGDGTFTLRFQVQNMTDKGLSHATIGLPEGAVPPSSGNYESKICP